MRKILAAALASAMVLSMASISAFAGTNSEYMNSVQDDLGEKFTTDNGDITKRSSIMVKSTDDALYYVNEDIFLPLDVVDMHWDDEADAALATDEDVEQFIINGGNDISDWSLKVKKNEGAKIVDKVTLVAPSAYSRRPMIKITFKPEFTDKEHKVDLDLTLTNKTKSVVSVNGGSDSLEESGKLFFNVNFYVSNETQTGTDHDYMAGRAGVVVKPSKNEDNEIIWENENKDIAKLTFFADSDVAKYYPKLNTKWDNQAYAEYFNDQDAYLFEFISNPQISSTSRATLELFNPYIDDDDEETIDPEEIIIYQIVDGLPVDVTSQFTYGENDNGDLTFATKTRVLGSYIFAEKPYEDAIAPDTDAPVDAPVDEAPVDTSKKPANTGRY